MRLLDRYIIRSFLINYLLAFIVLVGMYTLLDLIINFDKFAKATGPNHSGAMTLFWSLSGDILDYYAYRMMVIFQQISAAIPLLAAGFTMIRMTRHNELTAMLASGVSLYRVSVPILLCAVFFSLLVIVDQEVLMPRFIDKLLRQQNEVNQVTIRRDPIFFVRDSKDNSLLNAASFDSTARVMKDVKIILRDNEGGQIGRIMAPEAVWVTDPNATASTAGSMGYWQFKEARQIDDKPVKDRSAVVAEVVGEFRRRTPLTPDQLDLVCSKKAVDYISTRQVLNLIHNSPAETRINLEKIMHLRFTQPIMNVVMLMMGIPFLLTREPRQLIKNMIYCTILTSCCFVATFVMFQMAGQTLGSVYIPPLLGTWLPVLIFAPFSLVIMDTIKT